jgi:hypothetical protein
MTTASHDDLHRLPRNLAEPPPAPQLPSRSTAGPPTMRSAAARPTSRQPRGGDAVAPTEMRSRLVIIPGLRASAVMAAAIIIPGLRASAVMAAAIIIPGLLWIRRRRGGPQGGPRQTTKTTAAIRCRSTAA